jgi:hypothetical protein
MKRIAFLALFLLVASSASVTIQHQVRGCHSWAVGTGPLGAAHRVTLARGATLRFVNNDVMPQKIVLKSGPKIAFSGKTNLSKPAASVKAVLAHPGVYTFGTVVGEDYVKGIKTIGEDNVLKLVVTVK